MSCTCTTRFPCSAPPFSTLAAMRGVPVVATIHNYKLACANGTFFRDGAVCHDCAHALPVPAVLHGCYRESPVATAPVALAMGLHRQAWKSLVSAYILISRSQRDLLSGVGLPPDRAFVRYNLIPHRDRPRTARTPTGGLCRTARRSQGSAPADGRLGPLPREVR